MEPKIPKKRGRKPKPKMNPVETKEIKIENNSIEKNDVSNQPSKSAVEPSNVVDSIKSIVEENKKKIKKYNDMMLSDEFIDGISKKFLRNRYPENYNYHDFIKQTIYKIKSDGESTNLDNNNWIRITYDAAEKLSKIIDYYLSSGPLTKNEVHLLDRSIYLLKSYYILQTKDIINQNIPNELLKDILYMPNSSTYTYKVFIGQMADLPFKTRIFKDPKTD